MLLCIRVSAPVFLYALHKSSDVVGMSTYFLRTKSSCNFGTVLFMYNIPFSELCVSCVVKFVSPVVRFTTLIYRGVPYIPKQSDGSNFLFLHREFQPRLTIHFYAAAPLGAFLFLSTSKKENLIELSHSTYMHVLVITFTRKLFIFSLTIFLMGWRETRRNF